MGGWSPLTSPSSHHTALDRPHLGPDSVSLWVRGQHFLGLQGALGSPCTAGLGQGCCVAAAKATLPSRLRVMCVSRGNTV